MNSDVRMASARIVQVQFLCALETNGPASATNRFFTSCAWQFALSTDVRGSLPIRVVPTSSMPSRESGYGLANVGRIIHEVGTTRMGNDAGTSVLNANCQAHDVKNLFVADAGPFVSNAHKNCTWTILALAMRTSEFIAQQRNQGTL